MRAWLLTPSGRLSELSEQKNRLRVRDMSDGEWLTYTEAAKRLGTTPDAIRQRVKRGQMQGSRGNDNRPRVWTAARLPGQENERGSDKSPDSPNRTESGLFGQVKALEGSVETLERELARAKEQADRAMKRAEDLGDRLVDAELKRADDKTARAVAEAEVSRLRAELEQARRPWWRRVVGR